MANYKKLIFCLIFVNLFLFLRSEDKKSVAFYPFGAYSNETSIFLGGYALYTYRPENLPENYKPSSMELNLSISFKHQLRFLIRNKLNMAKGKYAIGIPLRYYNWPTTYYGIGNQKKPEIEENYTRQFYEFYPYFEYHFQEIFILAVSAYLEKSMITKSEADNTLLGYNVAGFEDYFLSGAEIKLERQTTDNNFFPTQGSNFAISTKFYHKSLGSDYSFRTFTCDLRKYLAISDKQTLAAQVLLNSVNGNPPFEKLPDLGNEMRGLDDKVYVNDHYFLSRIEDRIFPFDDKPWMKFGFAFFIESGQSFQAFNRINIDNQRFSAGFGIRYILLPSERLTLRCDFAWSRDGYEIKIISFEAF